MPNMNALSLTVRKVTANVQNQVKGQGHMLKIHGYVGKALS